MNKMIKHKMDNRDMEEALKEIARQMVEFNKLFGSTEIRQQAQMVSDSLSAVNADDMGYVKQVLSGAHDVIFDWQGAADGDTPQSRDLLKSIVDLTISVQVRIEDKQARKDAVAQLDEALKHLDDVRARFNPEWDKKKAYNLNPSVVDEATSLVRSMAKTLDYLNALMND